MAKAEKFSLCNFSIGVQLYFGTHIEKRDYKEET